MRITSDEHFFDGTTQFGQIGSWNVISRNSISDGNFPVGFILDKKQLKAGHEEAHHPLIHRTWYLMRCMETCTDRKPIHYYISRVQKHSQRKLFCLLFWDANGRVPSYGAAISNTLND